MGYMICGIMVKLKRIQITFKLFPSGWHCASFNVAPLQHLLSAGCASQYSHRLKLCFRKITFVKHEMEVQLPHPGKKKKVLAE